MNLNALEQDVYRRLGFNTGTPDTATQTRIRAYVNETQQEILSAPGMESLLYDTVTFASVASTPTYALPPTVARIRQVYDTTNLITLAPASLGWYRAHYPNPTNVTGIPEKWIDLGFVATASQPTAAAELFVKSDAAGDGSSKTAFLEGYVTGGYVRTASVALNGVTAVSFGASITSWIEITKFYIALTAGGTTTAAGNITINQGSGIGTELARIGIGQAYARYRALALAICPASAITYTADIERDVLDMSQATDEPLLPVRFHRLLAIGARRKEYEKQDDLPRYGVADREYQQGLKELKFYVYSQAVGSPNLRGVSVGRKPSRLGAWFSVDRW